MKKLLLAICLLPLWLSAQTPPPAPASAQDVAEGIATYKFISPATAAAAGITGVGGGGPVTNYTRAAVIANFYTNDTAKWIDGVARLGTSTAGTLQCSVTNSDNTLYFQYQEQVSTAGAGSNSITFKVPPGGWWKFIGITTTATDGSQQLLYTATNGSVTYATSAGSATTVSSVANNALEIPAIMNTNGMPVFNVVKYGADPLGVKWSATNIQAAIDAATNAGGGIVYFPPGRFQLGEDIGKPGYIVEALPCAFVISGNNVQLRGASGFNASEVILPASGGAFRNMLGSALNTNVGVYDLTLNGNFCTEAHDLTQFHTNNTVVFERVCFKNSLSNEGADTDGSYNVWVKDCVFSDCGGGGVGFGGPPTGGGNWFITGNVFNRGGTNDGGAVEDSAAIVVKPDWGLVTIENNVVEYAPVILTSSASSAADVRVTKLRALTSGTANTNVFHTSGTLTLDNCFFYATNSSGFFIDGGNNLTINKCYFNGKQTLVSANKLRTTMTGCTLENSVSTHTIQILGGGYHKFANNNFDCGGYSAVRFLTAPVTNSVVEGNTFAGCNLVIDAGASNNLAANNLFKDGSWSIYASKWNKFVNNEMANSGTVTVGSGSAQNYVSGGRIYTLTFDSAQDWIFENVTIAGTIGGAATYNSSTFINPRDLTGQPLRNYTITTNYTADAVDSVLIFNGSSVTNTIPSAVTVKRRKTFTIKNIHSTALEITNANGAQTFDGALRLSLPQYSTRTIMSDGANWQIIGN